MTFPADFNVSSERTFTLKGNFTLVPVGVGNSVSAKLTSGASFVWTDVTGAGAVGAQTGALINGFPTNSLTVMSN